MTVQELIDQLAKEDPNKNVVFLNQLKDDTLSQAVFARKNVFMRFPVTSVIDGDDIILGNNIPETYIEIVYRDK